MLPHRVAHDLTGQPAFRYCDHSAGWMPKGADRSTPLLKVRTTGLGRSMGWVSPMSLPPAILRECPGSLFRWRLPLHRGWPFQRLGLAAAQCGQENPDPDLRHGCKASPTAGSGVPGGVGAAPLARAGRGSQRKPAPAARSHADSYIISISDKNLQKRHLHPDSHKISITVINIRAGPLKVSEIYEHRYHSKFLHNFYK
jgi:hypothetical protein